MGDFSSLCCCSWLIFMPQSCQSTVLAGQYILPQGKPGWKADLVNYCSTSLGPQSSSPPVPNCAVKWLKLVKDHNQTIEEREWHSWPSLSTKKLFLKLSAFVPLHPLVCYCDGHVQGKHFMEMFPSVIFFYYVV